MALHASGQIVYLLICSLIDAGHPENDKIECHLSSLNKQWDLVYERIADQEKKLADAAKKPQVFNTITEVR